MFKRPVMSNSTILGAITTRVFSKTQSPLCTQVRYVEKGAKPPAKAGTIDKVNMPGFVTPENAKEEGYFTQKAKHQLEELKKKMDKPKVKNDEKKD